MKNKSSFYSISNLSLIRGKGQREPVNKDWSYERMLNISNEGDDTAVVRIFGEIGFWGIDAQDVVDRLDNIAEPKISLRINSPGGNVFDGIAILSSLLAQNKPIDAHVDGIAASIASVILMAGDSISMNENTRLMIHDPFIFAGGNATELRASADMLDMVKDDIVTTYLRHATIPEKEIRDMMTKETFISAADSVEMGFAQNLVTLRKPAESPGDKGGDNPQNTDTARELELIEFEAAAG